MLGCRCRASLSIPPHPDQPEPHSPLLLCRLLLLLNSRHIVAAPRTQVDRLGHLYLPMMDSGAVWLLLGRVAVGGRRRVLPKVGLGVRVDRGFRRVRKEGGVADRLRASAGSTGSDDEEGTDDEDDKDGCNDACESAMSSVVVIKGPTANSASADPTRWLISGGEHPSSPVSRRLSSLIFGAVASDVCVECVGERKRVCDLQSISFGHPQNRQMRVVGEAKGKEGTLMPHLIRTHRDG